ncbi:MAG: hypothetical protein LBS77_07125 [Desulfovibrio sp.]|nr:hypothetical protein [Desulfovibrio sp.]
MRHIPSREYSESLKKALSYEAFKKFFVNAANLFWDKVIPKNKLSLSMPYHGCAESGHYPGSLYGSRQHGIFRQHQSGYCRPGHCHRALAHFHHAHLGAGFVIFAAQLRPALELAKKARSGYSLCHMLSLTYLGIGYALAPFFLPLDVQIPSLRSLLMHQGAYKRPLT